ncbi:RE1-silencing transcription factor [Denticeps clupeoides]|uniref:C2H2-type domain-containing protein n=1 Tax=Denticeps clupeoides TaxID=299321 RepID=A0AAY4E744_9TELE|nr:zinc finger protein 518B [Denticeps clupeoides]
MHAVIPSTMYPQNVLISFVKLPEDVGGKKDPSPSKAVKNVNEKFYCNKCRFATKHSHLYERHLSQHAEMTFSCPLCSHVSYTKVESQRHAVKHSGSFPYRCPYCVYGAVRRDYIVKHLKRVHHKDLKLGEEPHQSHFTGGTGTCSSSSTAALHTNGYVDLSNRPAGVSSQMLALVPNVPIPMNHSVPKPINRVGTTSSTLVSVASHNNLQKSYFAPYINIAPNQSVATCISSPTCVSGQMISITPSRVPSTMSQSNAATSTVHASPSLGYAANRFMNAMGQSSSASPTGLPLPRPAGIAANGTSSFHPKTAKQLVEGKASSCPKAQPQSRNDAVSKYLAGMFGQSVSKVPNTPVQAGSANRKTQTEQMIPNGVRPNNTASHMVNRENKSTLASGQCKVLPELQPKPSSDQTVKPGMCPPVQVEVLEPSNQPIQHNKPLLVSYPEDLNIPPGSLVELVEVKDVNGAQELQLRIVPQLSLGNPVPTAATGPLKSSTFSCKVTTDRDQTKPLGSNTYRHSPQEVPQSTANKTRMLTASFEPGPRTDTQIDKPVVIKEENDITSRELERRAVAQISVDADPLGSCPLVTCKKEYNEAPPAERQHVQTSQSKFPGIKGSETDPTAPMPAECHQVRVTGEEPAPESLPVILSVFSLGSTEEALSCFLPAKLPLHGTVGNEVEQGKGTELEATTGGGVVVEKAGRFTESATNTPDSSRSHLPGHPQNEELAQDPPTRTVATITDFAKAEPENSDLYGEATKAPTSQTKPTSYQHLFVRNPKVTLVRISNIECLVNPDTNKIPQKPADDTGDLNVTARPVLSCSSNKENMSAPPVVFQTALKLTLKRKLSEAENRTGPGVFEALRLEITEPSGQAKKRRKKEKAVKMGRTPLAMEVPRGTGAPRNTGRLWLTPLKDDQLVKQPGPNQPVVVLNHPNPLNPRIRSESRPTEGLALPMSPLRILLPKATPRAAPGIASISPSLKMTLKKVQGNKYQVTELIAKGINQAFSTNKL